MENKGIYIIKKPSYKEMYVITVSGRSIYLSFDDLLSGVIPKQKKEMSQIEMFWEKVEKPDDLTKCWIWKGAKNGGYGTFGFKGLFGERRSHRIAYILMHGCIPEGKVIAHSCDNPSCVNPLHLRACSILENNEDKVLRGRNIYHRISEADKTLIKTMILDGYKLECIQKTFPNFHPSTVYIHYCRIKKTL